jgi:hypothetical protein
MAMTRAVRCILAGVIGVFVGYSACTVAGNLEEYPFFTIRQWVTGKTVMSEIVHHPASKWIIPILVSFFVLGGATVGVLTWLWIERARINDTH